MKLLGDWNWYLPSWLEWLPRLEPPVEEAERPKRVEAPAEAPAALGPTS
jgi:RND superfamily putative drug exporter